MVRPASPAKPEPATTIDTSFSEALHQPSRARAASVTLPPSSSSPTVTPPVPAYIIDGQQLHRCSSAPPRAVYREPIFHERLWEAMEDRADRFEEDPPFVDAQEHPEQQSRDQSRLRSSPGTVSSIEPVSKPQSAPPSVKCSSSPDQRETRPGSVPMDHSTSQSRSRCRGLVRRASRQFGMVAETIQRSITDRTRSRHKETSDSPRSSSDTSEQTPFAQTQQDPFAHPDDEDDIEDQEEDDDAGDDTLVEPLSGFDATYVAFDTRGHSFSSLVSPNETNPRQGFRQASPDSEHPSEEALEGEGSERDMTQTLLLDYHHLSDEDEDVHDLPDLDYTDCVMSAEWEEGFVPWTRRKPARQIPGGITRARGHQVHVPGAANPLSVHYRVHSPLEGVVRQIFYLPT